MTDDSDGPELLACEDCGSVSRGHRIWCRYRGDGTVTYSPLSSDSQLSALRDKIEALVTQWEAAGDSAPANDLSSWRERNELRKCAAQLRALIT